MHTNSAYIGNRLAAGAESQSDGELWANGITGFAGTYELCYYQKISKQTQ